MNMCLKQIIIQPLNNKIKKKRNGYAWYMGTFFIVAMLAFSLLFISKWKIELITHTIEDMTTSSALGSMKINAQQYALFRETVFSSEPGASGTNINSEGRVSSPDYCFEKLQDLIGENINLTRTPGTCSYSGESGVVDSITNPLIIQKAVYYNWYQDSFVESYTYTPAENSNGYICTYTANETEFPTGAIMDNSGIYIEVEIPINFMGKHTSIIKGQWISANFNN